MVPMNNANDDFRADHDAACRVCDECGQTIEPGEQVNPTTMAEAFCSVRCWRRAEADEPAPPPADPGRTNRIVNVTMAALVFGEVV